jgi:hypothetical protein
MYTGKKATLIVCSILGLLLALNSSSVFAKKTTGTVTNNSGKSLIAVFRAAGCAKISLANVLAICHTEDAIRGKPVVYEFGGGTSGRTIRVGFLAEDSMASLYHFDTEGRRVWHKYDGKMVSIATSPQLGSIVNGSGCVKDVGILNDASTTWTTFRIEQSTNNVGGLVFKVYCNK